MLRIYILVLSLGLCWGLDIDHLAGLRKGSSIDRPCPSLETDCVRKNLAERSTCIPVTEQKTDSIHIDYAELPLPHANATFIWEDAEMSGLENWKIKEFYINSATKRIVLEVLFDEVTTQSDKTHVLFFLKGREPVTVTSYFSFTHTKSHVTATIPYDSVCGINWKKLYAFTYFEVDTMPFVSGSDMKSTDPDVKISIDEMLAHIDLGLKEVSQDLGKLFFNSFLNNFLCKIET